MTSARGMIVGATMLALAVGACTSGPDQAYFGPPEALMLTPDMVSNIEAVELAFWHSSTAPVLAFSLTHLHPSDEDGARGTLTPEEHDERLRAILEGMRLYRIDDGSPIEAEARQGSFSIEGAPLPDPDSGGQVFSLVPSAPLAPGWYVFGVDLSGAADVLDLRFSERSERQREGSLLFARVYAGSRPTWVRSAVDCLNSEARCTVGVSISESRESPLTGSVRVTYDGTPVGCEPIAGVASPLGVGVLCPEPAQGTRVGVDFETDLAVDTQGRALVPGDDVSSVVVVSGSQSYGLVDPELGLDLIRSGP